jgi:hypothetical protein
MDKVDPVTRYQVVGSNGTHRKIGLLMESSQGSFEIQTSYAQREGGKECPAQRANEEYQDLLSGYDLE